MGNLFVDRSTLRIDNSARWADGDLHLSRPPHVTLWRPSPDHRRAETSPEALLEHWDGQMSLFDTNPRREVSREQKVVIFDLETQRSFEEVGGRSQFHRLGVSVGVAYRYDQDDFLVVTEETIGQLISLLLDADLVVGYNIRGFDYEVLAAYTEEDLHGLPTFDLMFDLEERLGFRPKLDSVASATLGEGKSADGLQALEWWKRGEIDKIVEYCREDVRVTRDLYDFGKRHRWVHVPRFGGKPRKVEVAW
jgi:DEAD/DEAH box helicase domain-containing protein